MSMYDKDIIPVCELCIEKDQKSCRKCGVAYCEHFSSDIDIRFCGNCMRTVSLTVETEIRKTDHLNDLGQITYSKRDVCKRLRLTGSDYFFAAAKIIELNDEDLETSIEYHRAIIGSMLMEREDRRVEKYQKMSKLLVGVKPLREDVDSTGALKGSLKTDKQKADSKKTRTTTSSKSKSNGDKLADAVALLLKAGLTADQISSISTNGGK